MFILNYILAFTLILLSVVKTADLFIHSDRALTKLQDQFVKTTKELIAPPKGNISLNAAVLSALLSLLLLFYVTKMKIEYSEARYRKDSYLCGHYLNIQTKKYIKEMSVFNWGLRSAFAAKSTVIAGVEGEVIWRALTHARNLRHFNYLRKLSKNKFCQFPETLSYLKNTPFKIQKTLALVTNIDETSIVREKQWTNTYYKNPKGIRLKKSFCLKSSFQLKNAFTPDPSYQSEEIAIVGLSSLKCLSGSSSSPPS